MPWTPEQKREARRAKALAVRNAGTLDATFVTRAEALLAKAVTAYDAKEIRDQIVTIETWTKERDASAEAIAHAKHARILAEIRIGELTAAIKPMPPEERGKKGGRSRKDSPPPGLSIPKAKELAEAGITKQQASRWERLAKLSPEEREIKIKKEVERTRATAGDKKAHVEHATGQVEWYTPTEILDVARKAMGGIDLDPASCAAANKAVGAEEFFDAKVDGLAQEWRGRVWLNPPYARRLVDRFAEKLIAEYTQGRVSAACVLVNNATDTAWFQAMMREAACVCFPEGRIRFIDKKGNPSGAPLQGQALLYFGRAAKRFCGAAADLGVCCEVV